MHNPFGGFVLSGWMRYLITAVLLALLSEQIREDVIRGHKGRRAHSDY